MAAPEIPATTPATNPVKRLLIADLTPKPFLPMYKPQDFLTEIKITLEMILSEYATIMMSKSCNFSTFDKIGTPTAKPKRIRLNHERNKY